MNTNPPTLCTESFLSVLATLIPSGRWEAFRRGEQLLLREQSTAELHSPLTAVIVTINGVRIRHTDADSLQIVAGDLRMPTYELWQVIDAGNNRGGYSGFNPLLRRRMEELMGLA